MPHRKAGVSRTLFLTLLACCPPAALQAQSAVSAARDWTNVVFVFTDDQGTVDLGAYGARDVQTPHLDALARSGVRFTQFYAAAAICSPSRAALLTGRYPQRAGVPGNIGPGRPGLPFEELTLAELFRDAGYATGLIGKWHLGSREAEGPRQHGFDFFFGHKQGCIDNYSHFFYWSGPNVHDLWRNEEEAWEEGTHFGELIVRETRAFLERHREEPFFLYLPFNTPHYPLQGTAKWREAYAGLETPRREYAALLSTLDEHIGAVLADLERLGLRESTLVVFQSDHGHSTEVRALGGGGDAGPHRGEKFSLLEGGIRVPAIASLPGVLPSGEVCADVAMAVDWYPTLAELCGIAPPARRLDGRSLAPLLRSAGVSLEPRSLHWQLGKQWAVRFGDWKLVAHPRDADGAQDGDDAALLLCNVSEDPGEARNLRAEQPEILARLTLLHETWKMGLARRVAGPGD